MKQCEIGIMLLDSSYFCSGEILKRRFLMRSPESGAWYELERCEKTASPNGKPTPLPLGLIQPLHREE